MGIGRVVYLEVLHHKHTLIRVLLLLPKQHTTKPLLHTQLTVVVYQPQLQPLRLVLLAQLMNQRVFEGKQWSQCQPWLPHRRVNLVLSAATSSPYLDLCFGAHHR